MAYYFAVATTEDSYEGLNIQKTKKFKQIFPENKKKYEAVLEEIDKFTVEYFNDTVLLNDLIYHRIIPGTYYSRMISIIYVNGIEVRKVAGDILYADSKKYIENQHLAIEYVENKIKENDITFLRNLSLKLPETSITTMMLIKLTAAMEEKQKYDQKTTNEKLTNPEKKQDIEKLGSDVIRLLFEDSYINGSGELVFSGNINYENFHNIVAYISEHERILEMNKPYVRTKKPQ